MRKKESKFMWVGSPEFDSPIKNIVVSSFTSGQQLYSLVLKSWVPEHENTTSFIAVDGQDHGLA